MNREILKHTATVSNVLQDSCVPFLLAFFFQRVRIEFMPLLHRATTSVNRQIIASACVFVEALFGGVFLLFLAGTHEIHAAFVSRDDEKCRAWCCYGGAQHFPQERK